MTASRRPGRRSPPRRGGQQLVTDQCTPLARTYLQDKLDPAGRYRPGALKPTQAAWDGGDRTVRCGLQAPGRTGALFPSRGRVADTDQAVVFDPGVCLALVGKEVSDPVAAARSRGRGGGHRRPDQPVPQRVPLGRRPGQLPPADLRAPGRAVRGSAQRLTDSKLTVYWTNIGADSWTAGTGGSAATSAPCWPTTPASRPCGARRPRASPSAAKLRPRCRAYVRGRRPTCPAAPPPRRPRTAPRPVATPASPRPRPPPAEPRRPFPCRRCPSAAARLLTLPPAWRSTTSGSTSSSPRLSTNCRPS